ncbi:MAG: hypothetical protein NTZ03_12920 [Actinobacteria bacterium]|nr:hypothetical protein [Actinomycetota bacterium]
MTKATFLPVTSHAAEPLADEEAEADVAAALDAAAELVVDELEELEQAASSSVAAPAATIRPREALEVPNIR